MLALVPVKGLGLAKQRLRPVLSETERAGLSLAMTGDVVRALQASRSVSRVLICAGDSRVAERARALGAEVILESSFALTGLNKVVNHLAATFYDQGEPALMVCHADIPGLQATEVDRLIHCLDQSDVVISPDGQDQGSNLLAWHLKTGFSPRYGTHSFQRHRQQARRKGLRLEACRLPSAVLDLDQPGDLLAILQAPAVFGQTETFHFLAGLDLPERLANANSGVRAVGVSKHVSG
jgi:2-phospho-L-lactate/phosphoenolpyruvate guanylyltransferase